MPMIVCALSLTLALLLEPTTPAGSSMSERELYHSAATAIEGRDLPRAVELLERLVTDHADGDLAEVAAYHLAECLWLENRAERALEVLAQWTPRIERQAQASTAPARPANDSARLVAQCLQSLDEGATTQVTLEKLLCSTAARQSSSFTVAVASELASRSQRAGNYTDAQKYLRQAVETCLAIEDQAPAELMTRLKFELPLAWAEHELSSQRAVTAVEILNEANAAQLSPEQTLAVRFLLAEALFAAGHQTQANEQFDWLIAQAEATTPKPAWLAAIALRRGELLVRSRDFSAARLWLLQAQREHADFARAYEFDYLLASCAVARIEFAEAQQLLQQVLDASTAQGSEAVPRAAWMLGEVHFLQRQFPQALEAYAQVARMEAFPDWQARALLQSAKCHELLGHARQALADYQLALQLSQQPEIQQQATQRVGAIESLTPKLR